jgi:cobalt-zinc-cadmium efflux system outer membrane protein
MARSAMRLRPLLVLLALVPVLAFEASARADGVVPVATELPTTLTLDEALRMFRSRGLDLLIAEANVRSQEGGVRIAGASPNPVVSLSVGNAITYSTNGSSQTSCLQNGAQCSPWINSVGLNDSAAIEDAISGKRDLRLKVARNALAAAKLSRADAERTIAFQVKSAYLQTAQAVLAYRFAKEVNDSNVTTLKKFQARLRSGAINEGDLARIETQKLESDQALDSALQALRQARVALAFLLGVRGEIPDFDVETRVLDFSVPSPLRDATEAGLLRAAFDHRPDLVAAGYSAAQARAQIELVKRQKFPDITLGLTYAWGGFGGFSTNGALQAPTVTFSVSAPLPVLYGLQGEQRQAEALFDTNSLQQAKTTAQVASDVSTAIAAFVTSRRLVERMEGPRREGGGELQSAKLAFDVTALQYEKGAASLTDYLDALRTYIATRVEYFGDLTNYWTAVFQLEQAVGMDLHS